MSSERSSHTKLFFKLLLLAVYWAFFSVQLFLRYDAFQAQQSLELNGCQKSWAAQPGSAPVFLTSHDHKESKPLSYLNKSYHPQDAVILPALNLQIQHFNPSRGTKFYFGAEHIASAKKITKYLRGPPALC